MQHRIIYPMIEGKEVMGGGRKRKTIAGAKSETVSLFKDYGPTKGMDVLKWNMEIIISCKVYPHTP